MLISYFAAPAVPNLLIHYMTNPDNLKIYFKEISGS